MQLRPYQEDAADFLFERDRAMVLAPMGAGKTAITLTAMEDMLADGALPQTGFIRQEDIPLPAFLDNRFGRFYAPQATPFRDAAE